MPITTSSNLQFLAGGGEMGQLTREKDWSKNPLGTPDKWPQSLRTTLSILLNSKFPMFLFWGPELICFYNDAYRPSLGNDGKHPAILGSRGEDFWKEIWKDIKPLIDNALDKGEASWFEDLLLPIYRNGKMEDVYWTFSYSPVNDESGKPAGVFVTCNETTDKILAFKQLCESNKRYFDNIRQASVAMSILRGKDLIVEIANELMLEIWGKKMDQVLNKPIFEGLPEAKEQGLEILLENVFTTGKKFIANERAVDLPRNGKIETTYLNFVYEALTEADGSISGIVATATEVTNQVLSRRKLEETEQKVRALVENAPFAIAVYTGEEMRVELANQSIIDIWGKGNDVIGKTFTEILPELEGQEVFEQIKEVYRSGKSFHTQNTPLDLIVNGKKGTYYFNYDFTPLYDLSGKIYGVMNTGIDLTDVYLAKKKTEEANTRFRNTVQQAPVGITILRGKEYVVEMANDAYLKLVDRQENVFLNRPLFDSLPEVKETVKHLLDGVLDTGNPYHGDEVLIPLVRHGKLGVFYFDFLYYPLKEEDGVISGVIVTVTEVTEKVQSRQNIERNEERLNIVIEASELGTWELNVKTREATYSDRYLEIIGGYTEPVKLTYDELLAHLHPDDMNIRNKAVKDAIATGNLHYEARMVWNDKSIHWMEGKGKVFYDDAGEPEKMIGTVRDITKERVHQLELEESQKRYHSLIYSSPSAIGILSGKDHVIAIGNDAIIEYWGKGKEIIGKAYFEALPELIPQGYKEVFDEVFKTGVAFNAIETPVELVQNGKMELKYYNFLLYPQKNIHGDIDGVGIIATEVTSQALLNLKVQASEKKFRLLSDSMPQNIWTSNTEGHLNYFNKSVVEYSGLSLEEIAEKGWLDIIHPDDREENVRRWMHSITTGEDFLFEHRFRRYDGKYRWQLSRAIPQRDENGKILMWVGTSTDIQDQKTSATELERQVKERTKELNMLNDILKQSEERYHLMVEEVQDYAILYLSKEGIVENWNKGAEKIKGYKAHEIIGQSFENFYTTVDKKSNLPKHLLEQAAKYGRFDQEGWRVRKDGTHFWASVVITAVHNDDGDIIGFSKVTHDLTAKKAADDKIKRNAAELEQKNEELEKMNKELQSFAYISSHDLQEPLRKIQTFSNLIVEKEFDNLSESGKDKFKRMQNAAQRMQTLINDLLAYSRTTSQEIKLTKANLNAIIDDVKEDLKEEILHKNAIVKAEKIAAEIAIVPFQIHQLLFNLISNSLKFSHEDTVPVISITSEIDKGNKLNNENLDSETEYCHLHYTDNGIGFDNVYNEKIFEVFQRLHGKERYEGTGIGLAIVKKIIDNHKGIITANGEVGKGATFDIYIPVKG
jgi:PAS domain S-box-containing protein